MKNRVNMFTLLIQCWEWIKAHNPGSPFKKARLNFITIHCMLAIRGIEDPGNSGANRALDIYILSLTIIVSLLLYAGKNLAYIDALFLACGCATLSGLNT